MALACNTGEADGDGSGGGEGGSDSTASSMTSPTTAPTTNASVDDTGGGTMGMDGASATDSATTSATTSATGASATDGDTDTDSMTGATTMGEPDLPPEEGCGGIDFLFVIDNSGSMEGEQAQLLASFPAFIAAIEASLGELTDSYHVGVITSDAYQGNAPGCTGLGDLVTQTAGAGSSDQVCTPFAEGNRYATEMDDLATVFPCIAQVGTTGSGVERPVSATIAALDPANGGAGACNEGFIRDEALLVVVILTDDPPYAPDLDDAHPTTDTTGWVDAVLAAKNDDPEAVVVMGFVPWMETGCVALDIDSPNLVGFVEEFGDQGVLASICEPDYGPAFAEAVSTIVSTCEEFMPIR